MWLAQYSVFHCVLFFFFFSSRRRHTRLQGDWSSDVCSSDLLRTPPHTALEDPRPHGRGHGAISQPPRRRNDPSDRSGDCNMTPTIMACHSFVWVRVHFVWATKRRQPWIAPEWRWRLFRHPAALSSR